jgi:uncharacterized protein YmfQ (DUF2313 family)
MTTLPNHSAYDYLQQFLRMLPRGRIWQRGWGLLQSQFLLTLMPIWVRLEQRALALLVDAFPCSTTELLPEWEASLGLPDACTGPLDTLQARQAAVCAKFAATGGASQDYFIGIAAALGFVITIQVFAPFYASRNRVGQRLFNAGWSYVWQVTLARSSSAIFFRTSASRVGERLVSYDSSVLECLFEQYKPAHTVVIFNYV